MSNVIIKRIITLFALFLLIFHFTLTLLFNSPIKVPYVNNYMVPLFDQNWRFFAPDPPVESRTLYFRYRLKKEMEWSNWINPGKFSQAKFDYNRFTYHGKLVHLNATICHYLNAEALNIVYDVSQNNDSNKERRLQFNKKIAKAGSMDLAKNYLKNWVLWRCKEDVNQLQLFLIIKDTKSKVIKPTLFPIIEL